MSSLVLVQSDARQIPLADKSVQCCVTSPPYWGLRDYGLASWVGGDMDCQHSVSDTPQKRGIASSTLSGGKATTGHQHEGYRQQCARCGAIRTAMQLGLEALHDCHGAFTGQSCGECYVCHIRMVFAEAWRVLRDDGTLWLNLGDSYAGNRGNSSKKPGYDNKAAKGGANLAVNGTRDFGGLREKNLMGIPWRVALALQADGWILRSAITWCKAAPMPESVTDRPTSATEQLFLLSKRATYYYDTVAVQEPSVSNHPSGNGYHRKARLTYDGRGQSEQWTSVGGMRNQRNYWVLNPEPTPFAHFATFPTELVRRCLLAGTSAHGCCPQCMAPWVRQVEHLKGAVASYKGSTFTHGKTHNARAPLSAVGQGERTSARHTTGWSPSCACPPAPPQPCTVLDPFAGSGTTGLVARELGRNAVLCDASWPYLHDIARARLGLTALAQWEGRNGSTPVTVLKDLPLFVLHGEKKP